MKTLSNTYGGKCEKGSLDNIDTFGVDFKNNNLYQYSKPELWDANIIRITPEMKQKILEEGLPSFALGGSVNNFIAPEDINIFA